MNKPIILLFIGYRIVLYKTFWYERNESNDRAYLLEFEWNIGEATSKRNEIHETWMSGCVNFQSVRD